MVNGIFKKVKSILFFDPRKLYSEEIGLIIKPFYFAGTNGQAVLLIHGWTSVPYEVRRLGKYLNENGYTVSGPLLRGHGTVPKDLEKVRWTDWLHDVTQAYEELKKNHEKVYVAGTSIGANLAAILAKNKPEVSGLVFMAMPYELKFEKAVIIFAKFLKLFKKYSRKIYPPTFGSRSTVTRLISYQSYPVASALETFDLVKVARGELRKVIQPCLILQSLSDHVVSRKSLEHIFENVGSKVKQKKYIKRAYHTFISDIKNEGVFEEILNFLNKN